MCLYRKPMTITLHDFIILAIIGIEQHDLMISEKKFFVRSPIVSLREMMTPGAWLIQTPGA